MHSLHEALQGLSWAASSRLGFALEAGLELQLGCLIEGTKLLSVMCENYPYNLKILKQRPAGLYCQGDLLSSDRRAVAVVGTRNPSALGIERTRRLVRLLAREGVTVVSGLARGIDTVAHSSCLQAGGRTLAVLGNGLNYCYPPENHDLQKQIARQGAVVSQFVPDFKATRWSFVMRNRLIAGLSKVSVAVECQADSGTLSELEWTWRIGRQVALPESLVLSENWAKIWVEQGKARVLRKEGEILNLLE